MNPALGPRGRQRPGGQPHPRSASRGGQAGGGQDQLTNLGLALLLAAGVLAGLLTAGVELATWAATGHPVRGSRVFEHSLATLAHGSRPASAFPAGSGVPGPVAVCSAVAAVVLIPGLLTLLAVAAVRRSRRRSVHRRNALALNRRQGMATRTDVTAAMRTLSRDVARTPDLRTVLLGTVHGRQYRVSSQQSVCVVGPARSGKSSCVIIPAVVEWDGPVVSTSTKDDVLRFTLAARAKRGPVWVFDPERPAGRGGFGWSPLTGCEDIAVARRRADDLVKAAAPTEGTSNASFFDGQARVVTKCLLHAAALDDAGLDTVLDWVLNSQAVRPVQILEAHGARREAQELAEQIDAPDRTRQSVWMTVSLCFQWVTPAVVTACQSVPACGRFDPRRLVTENGTLYIEPSEQTQQVTQVLLAALLGDVVQTALTLANGTSATGRLDPPLLVAADEVANIAPWKGLPSLLSQSGGQGICVILGLQNAAQALDRWGPHQGRLITENSTTRMVFPGLKSAPELQDLSTLIGSRDENTLSTSRQTGPRAEGGSHSVSARRVRTLEPDEISALPEKTALVLGPAGTASVLSVVHYSQRPVGTLCEESDRVVREIYLRSGDVTGLCVAAQLTSPAGIEMDSREVGHLK